MAGHKHPSYGKIYVALLVLFVISVAGPEVAHILGMEGVSRTVLVLTTAFGIALVKAYMVCAYFMHLKFEKIYAPYILLAMTALLFVFFFGTATDVMKPDGHHWEKIYKEETGVEDAQARYDHAHAHDGDHGEDHGEHGDEHESKDESHGEKAH